jgi:hypothetical protein
VVLVMMLVGVVLIPVRASQLYSRLNERRLMSGHPPVSTAQQQLQKISVAHSGMLWMWIVGSSCCQHTMWLKCNCSGLYADAATAAHRSAGTV